MRDLPEGWTKKYANFYEHEDGAFMVEQLYAKPYRWKLYLGGDSRSFIWYKDLFGGMADHSKDYNALKGNDPIVDQVREEYKTRSRKGVEKYGTTLAANDDPITNRLQHAKEEAMDLTLYLQWAIGYLSDNAALLLDIASEIKADYPQEAELLTTIAKSVK